MTHPFRIILDGTISKVTCEEIISKYKVLELSKTPSPLNYYYAEVKERETQQIHWDLMKGYHQRFPQLTHTENKWNMSPMRVKMWKPGIGYTKWHSEHTLKHPRIAMIMTYLTDNSDSATEFYDGQRVETKAGTSVICTASWIDCHRGEISSSDRWMLTSYCQLVE